MKLITSLLTAGFLLAGFPWTACPAQNNPADQKLADFFRQYLETHLRLRPLEATELATIATTTASMTSRPLPANSGKTTTATPSPPYPTRSITTN